MAHVSVLTEELVAGLNLRPDSTVVDCTFGAGGHAEAILAKLDRGTYLGIDADPSAVEAGRERFKRTENVRLVCENFRNISAALAEAKIEAPDAIVADLGWRSEQFEAGGKGFSFNTDEPLVMTFGDPAAYPFTAHDIANGWEEGSLIDIIRGYGEERFAGRIARAIVAARADGEIATSGALAEIVESAIPRRFRPRRIHAATKTFQAFRMAVNDELGALRDLLADGPVLLAPHGRMAIITFHSIEDRVVKQHFVALEHDQTHKRITKKPVTAREEELEANPRARSAKLRIIERL